MIMLHSQDNLHDNPRGYSLAFMTGVPMCLPEVLNLGKEKSFGVQFFEGWKPYLGFEINHDEII